MLSCASSTFRPTPVHICSFKCNRSRFGRALHNIWEWMGGSRAVWAEPASTSAPLTLRRRPRRCPRRCRGGEVTRVTGTGGGQGHHRPYGVVVGRCRVRWSPPNDSYLIVQSVKYAFRYANFYHLLYNHL